MKVLPYGRHTITQGDIDAVVGVLKSDFLTQGPKVTEFEKAFASYVGSKYALAVSNGTAALHLAALALNISDGDVVLTTPITFSATANCIKYCGGVVDFIDINPETYCIDIKKLASKLELARSNNYIHKIKGIIVVDFAGYAINLQEVKDIADMYDLWIIEDACHAPGGFFFDKNGNKQFCGSCNFTEMAIFSFHPVKHIATGEGGMITTNDSKLYEKIFKLRTHGITRESSNFMNSKEFAGSDTEKFPDWYMEMQDLGYNYRLTDFQAALGISQLARAESGLIRRREIAEMYDTFFKGKRYILGNSILLSGHAYHLYVIEVEQRFELYKFLRENNVFAQVHYIPVHLMPYYRKLGWNDGDLPVAELYYKNCLSLPMYPALTNDDIIFVTQLIDDFFKKKQII